MEKNSLNKKKEQYIVSILIEQSCRFYNNFLYFPLLLNNHWCSKDLYTDRIKFQLTLYMHADGKISLDNFNIKEAGSQYLPNLSYFHLNIKRNIKSSIQLQIFPLYLEDEVNNVSHANMMIIAYDKFIKKKYIFIFDPFGSGKKNVNDTWWSDDTNQKIKRELEKVVKIFLFTLEDDVNDYTWYLPNNDSFMGNIQPQLRENDVKDISKQAIGFCSTWCFIFVHFIGMQMNEYFKWNNNIIGIHTLIKIIKLFGILTSKSNAENLAYIVQYYSRRMTKLVNKSELYCLNGKPINEKILEYCMNIINETISHLYISSSI